MPFLINNLAVSEIWSALCFIAVSPLEPDVSIPYDDCPT